MIRTDLNRRQPLVLGKSIELDVFEGIDIAEARGGRPRKVQNTRPRPRLLREFESYPARDDIGFMHAAA